MGGDEAAAVTTALDANTLFFLLGVAVDCFLATLKTERRWVRNLLRGMTVILVLGAFSWPFLSKLLPVFAASVASVVSSAWAWFILVIATAVIGSLDSVIQQWWANRLSASSVVMASPPSTETPTEGGNVSLALSRIASASTTVDTEHIPSGITILIIFVIEQSYVNYTEGKDFPLKLRMRWTNQGDGAHIGKPRWEPTRAYIPDRQLMCRFKSLSGKYKTESEEIDVKRGKRGELWFALDQAMNVEQVERWREASQLGVLTLPITVGTITREVQIQL